MTLTFKQFFEAKATKTVALVPGSFKPMHKGHWAMIEEYADKADEVIVIISDPKKSVRKTKSGKVISPEVVKQIADIYTKASGRSNIKTVISNVPSPVSAASDYAEKNLSGQNVIFGSSKKGDDWKRWNFAIKYFAEKDPTINVLDPKENAVDAKFDDMSATDMRNSLEDLESLKKFLPDFLSDKDVETIHELLK